jgi:hypothetical protein
VSCSYCLLFPLQIGVPFVLLILNRHSLAGVKVHTRVHTPRRAHFHVHPIHLCISYGGRGGRHAASEEACLIYELILMIDTHQCEFRTYYRRVVGQQIFLKRGEVDFESYVLFVCASHCQPSCVSATCASVGDSAGVSCPTPFKHGAAWHI